MDISIPIVHHRPLVIVKAKVARTTHSIISTMCNHPLPPAMPGNHLRISGWPTHGNSNKEAKRVDMATPSPLCRNIIKATKVTTTDGISLAANSVIVHNPPSLLGFI
jgi:hypothetical protein